jgi:hypothetical protein
MSSTSRKGFVAVGALVLVGAVGYTNVYLPFYSSYGQARRDEYKRSGKVPVVQGGTISELNKGSMWAQLDRGLKGADQGHSKSQKKD